jgi:TetR/AcrR family transcriptional regulator, cholesterol catabolism regulator
MRNRSPKDRLLNARLAAETTATRRIVTAARRIFFAHGFRSVTMDDVAEELGMSKKTLYVSFPSKTALLQAILQDKLQDIDSDLAQNSSRLSADTMEALQQLLACIQKHTGEIQPAFLRDMRREAPELFQVVQSQRQEMIQRYFGKIFDKGRKAGIFRRDIPSNLLTEILLGATEAIVNPGRLTELGLTPKEGFLSVITVVLEGVMTEKGRSTFKRRGGEAPSGNR